MTEPSTQLSTFERSCQHWSEEGKAEMEAFYRLAKVDYQLLAEQVDWCQVFTQLQQKFGDNIHLLDVACGSGQFPNALLKHSGLSDAPKLNIQYSLLDPSQFSIDVAREKLKPPFQPAEELLCTAQDTPLPTVPYSAVWATHALYCVPPDELSIAVDRMLAVMDPRGLGFIAHASREAHYLQFHDLYLQTAWAGDSLPYSKGEHIIELLQARMDASRLKYWSINYEGTIPLDEPQIVERYLQRCLFDDQISLEQMLDTNPLGDYLRQCMDSESGRWRFRQKAWLIFYGESAQKLERVGPTEA